MALFRNGVIIIIQPMRHLNLEWIGKIPRIDLCNTCHFYCNSTTCNLQLCILPRLGLVRSPAGVQQPRPRSLTSRHFLWITAKTWLVDKDTSQAPLVPVHLHSFLVLKPQDPEPRSATYDPLVASQSSSRNSRPRCPFGGSPVNLHITYNTKSIPVGTHTHSITSREIRHQLCSKYHTTLHCII